MAINRHKKAARDKPDGINLITYGFKINKGDCKIPLITDV